MKHKIKTSPHNEPPLFPVLMSSKQGDVFLITGHNTMNHCVLVGTALHDGSQFKAGEKSSDLNGSNFTKFNGSIELSND